MDAAIDRIMQTYDLLMNQTAAANAEAREICARRCISHEVLHGSWLPNLFI